MSLLCLMETGVSCIFLTCLNEVTGKGTLQMKRQCVWGNRVKFFKDDERWPPSPKRTGLLDEKTTPLVCTGAIPRLHQCQECSQEHSGFWWYSKYLKELLSLSKPSRVWWLKQEWWSLIADRKGFRFQILCVDRNQPCPSRPRVINVAAPQTLYHLVTPMNLFSFLYFFSFWLCRSVYGISVPRPGTELGPSAVRAQSPNHWTAREFPHELLFKFWFWND